MRCFALIIGCGLLATGWLGCRSLGPQFDPHAAPGVRPGASTNDIPAALTDGAFTSVENTNAISRELLQAPTNFYTLGPGDLIEIEILGEGAARSSSLVGPDGKIYFSLLPGTFVWGLTLEQARDLLERELMRYVRTPPELTLTLRSAGSKRIWILGSVQQPGVYPLATPTALLEAIALAGGTLIPPGSSEDIADLNTSFIMRDGKLLPVNFQRLLREGDLSQNVYLQPDDLIMVRPGVSREVYVLGAVLQPRVVPYVSQLSLVGAVSAAGGTVQYAYASHLAIIRGSLTDPRIAIVDYGDMAKGKIRDVRLEPGDIVYVPFAPYRRVAQLAEQVLDQFVRTIAINEGRNAVLKRPAPVGVSVGLGSGL